MSEYPRVLIFSNNCLSKSGSNGRTLGNFFKGYPCGNIAQFYIHNEEPDLGVSMNYYRVTDDEVLRAFIKGGEVGSRRLLVRGGSGAPSHPNRVTKSKRKKDPLTMILRNIIWNSRRWQGNHFKEWLNEFDPEVILVQSGDASFMLKLAAEVAQQRSIPLVIYNSEDYYFKNTNYFDQSNRINAYLYPLWHRGYRKQFEKTIAYSTHSIYSCDLLKNTYSRVFNLPGTVILTSTEVKPLAINERNHPPRISYLGNLGVGRHKALIEIAEALQEIDVNFNLDVYGSIPNPEIGQLFDCAKGINYRGFVPYEDVVEVMHNSDLLVHAEDFSDFRRRDLRHAFSTKIADTLASGTCLFMYAPEELACTQYLLNNGAACVVTDQRSLKSQLKLVLEDNKMRGAYVENALRVVEENHNMKTNCLRFQEVIRAAVIQKMEEYDESTTS